MQNDGRKSLAEMSDEEKTRKTEKWANEVWMPAMDVLVEELKEKYAGKPRRPKKTATSTNSEGTTHQNFPATSLQSTEAGEDSEADQPGVLRPDQSVQPLLAFKVRNKMPKANAKIICPHCQYYSQNHDGLMVCEKGKEYVAHIDECQDFTAFKRETKPTEKAGEDQLTLFPTGE